MNAGTIERARQGVDKVFSGRAEESLLATLDDYRNGQFATGAFFERFDAPASEPNELNFSDVAATWSLSVPRSPGILRFIEQNGNAMIKPLLARWPDQDLASMCSDCLSRLDSEAGGLGEAWKILVGVDGVGAVTASKLLAKKRPHLVPIYDQVIAFGLGLDGSRHHWTVMHRLLTENEGRLQKRLLGIVQAEAERHPERAALSALRVFDILMWMHYRREFREQQHAKPVTR